MSFISKLFLKNKTSNSQTESPKRELLTLKQIPFSKISNEEFEKYWQMRLDGKISDSEYDNIRRRCMPHCTMSTLADNGVSLYRMAKSSSKIAQKSIEQRPYKLHEINKITAGHPNGHGLSLTTAENLLSCIPYGDTMIQIRFDKSKLQENGMLEELVYRSNDGLDEYSTMKFITTDIFPLSKPETLKQIISLASDVVFEKNLIVPNSEKHSISYALKNFELFDTLTYWENIKDRYQELVSQNVENKIGILRLELCDILNKTPTIANDVFNNKEDVNLTTDNQNKDREEL